MSKNKTVSFKVLPLYIKNYNYQINNNVQSSYILGRYGAADIYSSPSTVDINISAMCGVMDFEKNVFPNGGNYQECCLVFGQDARLIRQRLSDTNFSEEFQEALANFKDKDELNEQVAKLKEEVKKLDGIKKFHKDMETQNATLKQQIDLVKKENDAIKAEIDKYNKNPPEGSTRFNLIEVD